MRRLNQPLHTKRSIDDVAHQGRHTQHERIPTNGLVASRRTVTKVSRGHTIDRAHLHETRPDTISHGALPVFARSGGDSDQHSGHGDPSGWNLVGDLSPAELQVADEKKTGLSIAIGAATVIGLLMLFGRRA